MTRYRYKARHEALSCGNCLRGFDHEQRWASDPLERCPECRSPVYRVVERGRMRFQFRHGMKGDMRDYREDLARFKGDPEAYVDGPRSVQKLIDKRKREGWQMGCGWDALYDTNAGSAVGDDDVDAMQLAREAVEEAKATGYDFEAPDVQAFLEDADPET